MNTKEKKPLTVINVGQCTGGMNPIYRIDFSDGNQMQSNCRDEFIESIYYKLMNAAIDKYKSKPNDAIGATSHEDFYNY
tara:strand:+ start:283 stop:519 length:237 start_codon:yes stop_codon:yes gene_type:complete